MWGGGDQGFCACMRALMANQKILVMRTNDTLNRAMLMYLESDGDDQRRIDDGDQYAITTQMAVHMRRASHIPSGCSSGE